ncbi:MAG: alpha/beta hydrolase [Chloroflexi bacterium]|nr:alpha/beta hydrolase [Chloroflexota bacterium]
MTEPEKPAGPIDPPAAVTPQPPAAPVAQPPAATGAQPPAAAAEPTAKRRRRPRRRTVVLGVVAVLVIALVGGLAWFFSPQPLLPEATAALASSPAASFSEEATGLTYTPVGASPTTGLILYPGAKVPAAGYAPTARAIAEEGYLVVVVPMPLNFAIFDVDAASGVIAAHPGITRWVIGGHSLGGAMAAQYAADNPGAVDGLALCGAYSASDLAASGLAASSVYGSLDAAAPKIEDPATQSLLPATTVYDRIEGGNHEQCGWYTGQPNDPPATITREDQQIRIVTAWLALLEAIASAP